jgi:23S rRNA (guanosine2251-2'-O)-methyltransferase
LNQPNLIYGKHPIYEALASGKKLEKILIASDSKQGEIAEIRKLAKEQQVPVQIVPVQKLNAITRKVHQGIIGFLSLIQYFELEDVLMKAYEEGRTPLFLVLDHVTDVRNFGAIARTALGAKVDAIVVPATGGAMIGSDALKTSAGALNKIHVCKVKSLTEALDFFKLNGIRIVAADMHTETYTYNEDFSIPLAIVMGAEDTGVSLQLIRKSDSIIKIPISDTLESYNVAVSAGMILYEVMRQRNLNNIV